MKENKGITLVALVITVIIIIILATVAISFAFGNNGLINRAEDARGMYANDTAYTEGSITNVESYINDVLIGEVEDNPDEPEEPTDPEEPIEPVEPTIENILKEGDYVYYEDGTGTTRKCAVLYGPENENYDSYGIQIISMDIVESITMGGSDFTSLMNSYNNSISIINAVAETKYNNELYSSGARSVGTVPDNPNYDAAGMFSTPFGGSYSGQLKDSDENYLTDWNQMNSLNIYNIEKNYWIPSRYAGGSDTNSGFNLYVVGTDGSLSINYLGGVNSMGMTFQINSTNGLRPVFTLNEGLKVTDGTGDENDPYILGV